MRIIPSENDGFVLITLDFACLNQLLLLRTNALQKDGSWFISRVLWNKFSLYCFLQNRFLQKFWELHNLNYCSCDFFFEYSSIKGVTRL